MKDLPGDTRATGAGDVSIPLLRQPLPRGRFPIDTVSRDLAVSSWSHLTLLKDPLSAHGTAIQGQSPHTARPLWRGREEAAERPGGGGGRRIPFNQKHRRQGRGTSPSPFSVSPSPTGVILHRYGVRGFGSLVAVSPDTPERSSLRPWHGYPVLSPNTCPPPLWRGREEAA